LDQDTKKKGESNLMLGNESSSCGGGKWERKNKNLVFKLIRLALIARVGVP
jgi:hypothetical protein